MSPRARANRHLNKRNTAAAVLFLIGLIAVVLLWTQDSFRPILLAVNVGVLALFVALVLRSTRRATAKQQGPAKNQQGGGDKESRANSGGTKPVPHAWKGHPQAKPLATSGVFSQSFYERVSDKSFAGLEDAASHYLTYSIKSLLPPNPFVDLQSLPADVQKAARRGDASLLLDHVKSAEPLGPAFDGQFVETDAATNDSPLVQFVKSIDEATPLPVAPSSPLAEVTAQAYAQTVTYGFRAIYDEKAVRQDRVLKHWDDKAEAVWKNKLRETPLSEQPLISVVMPVKDRAVLVKEAIASIQAQTYDRWELIVVDDHSSDGTWAVLQDLAVEDHRITALSNPRSGVSAARNVGLAKTSGDYIAFLDSDNTWVPDFLECMIRGMIRDNLEWAYSGSKLIDESNETVEYMAYEGGRDHFLIRNHIDLNIMVVRAELIGQTDGFDETLRRWVDYDLVLRLLDLAEPRLLPFIGCHYDHSMDRKDRITVKEAGHWQGVVLSKYLLDWESAVHNDRIKGRVSVVLPTFEKTAKTLETIDSIVEFGGFEDLEIVVVDQGSSNRQARRLIQHLAGRGNVRILRQIRNFGDPIAKNAGFLETTGEYVLFLDCELMMREGWLKDLIDPLKDDSVAGVIPLLLKQDDTIASAGISWVSEKALPVQFLENHPKEDANFAEDYRFTAAHDDGLLVRATDFIAVRGFASDYVRVGDDLDLSLRLSTVRSGGFRVVPSAVITQVSPSQGQYEPKIVADLVLFMDRWRSSLPAPDTQLFEKAGLSILQVGPDSSLLRPKVAGTRVTVARKTGATRRWGIKNPADPGIGGDAWGDTHFIASFAESLRNLGQEVVTFRHSSHAAPSVTLDDVSLVIRGMHRTIPVPGKLNILWIISHPDKVTRGELEEFDLIYAASHSWARWATEEYGVEVRPLLQATDSSRFYFKDRVQGPAADVVFVGGHFANRQRKVVLDAVVADVDLKVYGPGWSGVIPDRFIGGTYVKNEELAEVYRGARFVLADHWELMAREGFIQNRLFDAVSSGCRVISDDVLGLREVFGEEVLVATGPDDIRRYVNEDSAGVESYLEGLLKQAADNVMNNHTFAARARQLLADVEDWERLNKA